MSDMNHFRFVREMVVQILHCGGLQESFYEVFGSYLRVYNDQKRALQSGKNSGSDHARIKALSHYQIRY